MTEKAEGIVYVLTNPAMEGMVKIGRTTNEDVEKRLKQLNNTSVPLPFECVYAGRVEDAKGVESALHIAFRPNRVNPKREFFLIEPEQAIVLLRQLATEVMTPKLKEKLVASVDAEETESAKKFEQSKRRPKINFYDMGIPKGSTLKFTEDEEITCKVYNEKQVEYEGKKFSLSRLTTKLLNRDYGISGTSYWTFNGENLADLYEEIYTEEL